MDSEFYLVVGKAGRWKNRISVRAAMKRPGLKPDEIVIRVRIVLPDSLFTRPQLRAAIVIPDGAAPPVIDARIQDNIAEVIRQQVGMQITLAVEGATTEAS